MKKFILFTTIIALLFIACDQPTDSNVNLPTLTIRNQSSFDLSEVRFEGILFASQGNVLPRSTNVVVQLSANELNKGGYITFIRNDIGITCRTQNAITVIDQDFIFTFLDTSLVEELANETNRGQLGNITHLSYLAVERGGLNVARNDIVNLGETVVNIPKQNDFIIKNSGAGNLILNGNEPVRITGGDGAFSVVQPLNSEIAANESLPFRINFFPVSSQTYSATVTISSNDQIGDFSFTIMAAGEAPKPVASVFFDNNEVQQNGVVDAGDVIVSLSKNIIISIGNIGTDILTIDTAGITITGTDALSFNRSSGPANTIAAGIQSSIVIECNPTKQGFNDAILTIPTNDSSRNQIIINLRVNGLPGNAVLELRQNNYVIANNSMVPVDFEQVEIGTNQTLVFTIRNTGNIVLELTGNPIVESSNSVFSVPNQPASIAINPGNDVNFTIRYTPITEGEVTATVTIMNNSAGFMFTFLVRGTGYERKPQIYLQQGNAVINHNGEYNFDNIMVGASSEIAFSIGNSGDASLTIETINGNRVNLSENIGNAFIITMQPSTAVSAGGTTSFTIRFNPPRMDNFIATVHIKSNSRDDSDFSFRIRGIGRGYNIGETGPAGGLIFFAQGNQFKEVGNYIGTGTWATANSAISSYSLGGFNDWYLPEIGDLDLIYKNIFLEDLGEFFEDDYFWSSTEFSNPLAVWTFDFFDGLHYPAFKTESGIDIVAVRTFTISE